ncbi:hypothetical protein C1T17_07960 [Sphingobium sp. SCG-1]|uniref:hypothetical protein n=1 Tax=Sphingobium sp. SCG-1 TaxID=2072936 RepID=UPI000CD6B176|nr:hypothetical protein [Sphingobium sp. SCG-1]AUW58052.1 hypothetical protein C1T17_07960 [Sphingobium sp. SCG-1]
MSDDIEEQDSEGKQPQPDMAQAEQILFYQDAPINGPASFQEAAQSRANFAQRLPGTSEWTIGNGVGSLSQLTREEKVEKDKQEADEQFEEIYESMARVHEEEQERQKWAQETHKYAGIEMTGAEWGEFADRLKGDTPLRKWLLEKLKKEGKTETEAQKTVDEVALLAKMQSLPQSQWTDNMKALDREMKANPEKASELQKVLRSANDRNAANDRDKEFEGPKTAMQQIAENANTAQASTDARDQMLSADTGKVISIPAVATSVASATAQGNEDRAFASAPDLGEHHRAAMIAKEPLDAPKQIASLTPPNAPAPASPGGGFDV